MTNIVKYEGVKDAAIDISEATVTYVLKTAATAGATLSAFSNDTIGTTAEDGYLSIDIAGTEYKIPIWADD